MFVLCSLTHSLTHSLGDGVHRWFRRCAHAEPTTVLGHHHAHRRQPPSRYLHVQMAKRPRRGVFLPTVIGVVGVVVVGVGVGGSCSSWSRSRRSSSRRSDSNNSSSGDGPTIKQPATNTHPDTHTPPPQHTHPPTPTHTHTGCSIHAFTVPSATEPEMPKRMNAVLPPS